MNIARSVSLRESARWAQLSLNDPLSLTFSKLVAGCIDWDAVECHVLVGKDVELAATQNFQYGGKTSGAPSPDDWLVENIQASAPTGRFFLIEDWRARPDDAFIAKTAMPAVFNAGEVYYVSSASDPRADPNWRRICSNSVPLFHGFVIQGVAMPTIGMELNGEMMEQMARSVKLFFLGIYDGESYMICRVA